MMDADSIALRTKNDLLRRNAIFETFFSTEAPRLARACQEMSRRFLAGGRLLAFGRGAAATDAQHVSVEFVHPVIVGKRALPALDLGIEFESRLPILLRPDDIVLGFAFPEPDPAVSRALATAQQRGALTFALASYSRQGLGAEADYPFTLPDTDPFIAQEVFEV
ncbi:MAG: phosphoheptose isomerase, partial [Chloroflexota bacterium]|nr:phosphoheptose isomerase [Chloroflexota bacterium]